jgi:FHA domain-containing protein
MTIEAQLPDSASPAAPEPDTLPIEATTAPRPDAVRLLDARTRARAVPEAGAPPGRYLATEGDGGTVLLPLDRPITYIGRGLIADLGFEDPRVSRRHAILAQRADGARVLDERSANGTFLNGRRITTAALHDGDVIEVGPVAVRYVEIPPPIAVLGPRTAPVLARAGDSGPAPLAA